MSEPGLLKTTPYPLAVRAYNGVWRALGIGKPIRADALIAKARKQTGLHDFGDESFLEPLNRLVDAINSEAELHPFGKMITGIRLGGILQNKLRAQHLFTKHPEIEDEVVAPILLITGLQRTGTTLLHRLLAADPATRSLKSWEALNPAPPVRGKDKRMQQARNSEKGLRYIAPDFFAIHPVEFNAPEEDVLLLDTSFISTVAEATLNVPSFAAWVEKTDQAPAYRELKRWLKLLQWQQPARRWVLKSPHHMEFLDAFATEFPQSRILQTHRDPVVTLASFSSMIYHSRRIFSDHVTPAAVAKHWLRKTARMTERMIAFREAHPALPVMDIDYGRFTQDPVQQLRDIYAELNWDFSADCEAAMDKTLHRSGKHKYGVHRYRLEDFGLTQEQVEQAFRGYRQRHILSTQTA